MNEKSSILLSTRLFISITFSNELLLSYDIMNMFEQMHIRIKIQKFGIKMDKLSKFKSKVKNKLKKIKKTLKKKIKKYKARVKKFLFRMFYYIFTWVIPIKKNKIAFLSDSRKELSGNFEYIHDEIMRRPDVFKTDYLLKKTNSEAKSFKEYMKLAWLIATSEYVLLDDFYPLIYPLKIRKGVALIQVWHAVGAFKTFGFSRVGLPGGPKITSKNHRNYTYAIVSSKQVAPNYAEGFGIDLKRVLPLGVARTDMFFDQQKMDEKKAKIRAHMPFIEGKKVILFAPTFRGAGQRSAHYPFEWIDYKALYDALADKGFIFLLKIHPFVKKSPKIPEAYSDFFYNVSDYREINDLLLTADVLVTDYSSVVFEYSLLKRKTIFFTPDLEEYTATRDFYVNYNDFIPGPAVSETDSLIQELLNYDVIDEQRLTNFLNYYFEQRDGKSSVRFVDQLVSHFKDFPID